MRTVFVTNAPVRSCCGNPPGRCRCAVDQDGLDPLPTMNALLAAEREPQPEAKSPKGKRKAKGMRPATGFRVPDYGGAAGGYVANRSRFGPVDQDDLEPLPTWDGR